MKHLRSSGCPLPVLKEHSWGKGRGGPKQAGIGNRIGRPPLSVTRRRKTVRRSRYPQPSVREYGTHGIYREPRIRPRGRLTEAEVKKAREDLIYAEYLRLQSNAKLQGDVILEQQVSCTDLSNCAAYFGQLAGFRLLLLLHQSDSRNERAPTTASNTSICVYAFVRSVCLMYLAESLTSAYCDLQEKLRKLERLNKRLAAPHDQRVSGSQPPVRKHLTPIRVTAHPSGHPAFNKTSQRAAADLEGLAQSFNNEQLALEAFKKLLNSTAFGSKVLSSMPDEVGPAVKEAMAKVQAHFANISLLVLVKCGLSQQQMSTLRYCMASQYDPKSQR